jgi:butyryl-CoA dehydrogenase
MTSAFAARALATVEQAARRVCTAASEGDALGIQLAVLRRFAKNPPLDEIALQRQIARHFLEQGRYRI